MSTIGTVGSVCKRWPPFFMILLVALAFGCSSDRGTPEAPEASRVASQAPATKAPIPEPSSWSFPDVVESARKLAPRNVEGKEFDQFGVAYSLAELDSVPMATMPAGELQKYADIVTHAYPDAVFRQIAMDCKSTPVEGLNSTAVAGVAYVSLHAQDPETRRAADQCLSEIQRRLRGKK